MDSESEDTQPQIISCKEICHVEVRRRPAYKNKSRPSEPELLSKILPGVMADIRKRRKLTSLLAACNFHDDKYESD